MAATLNDVRYHPYQPTTGNHPQREKKTNPRNHNYHPWWFRALNRKFLFMRYCCHAKQPEPKLESETCPEWVGCKQLSSYETSAEHGNTRTHMYFLQARLIVLSLIKTKGLAKPETRSNWPASNTVQNTSDANISAMVGWFESCYG